MDVSGFGGCQVNGTYLTALCLVEFGGGGTMVWGYSSGVGLVPLGPGKGPLNTSADQEILDSFMLPTLWEQHDCAPVHKARSIKTWMSAFGVEELDCHAVLT